MTDVTLAVRTPSRAWAIMRTSDVVRLSLFGLMFANVGRIPAFSTGDRNTAILLNDVFVALVISAGIAHVVRHRSLKLDKVAILGLLFALVGAASTLWSMNRFALSAFEVLVSLSYLARWLFYFAMYIVMINVLKRENVDELTNTLETVILIVAIFGIVQAIFFPNFGQVIYPNSRPQADWDAQGHRLVSTWLDPVFVGAFITTGLLLEFGQIAVRRRVAVWKPVVLTIALLMTVSRASLVMALVGMAILVVVSRSRRLFVVVGSVVGGVGAATPAVIALTKMEAKYTVDASGLQRIIAWIRALRVFAEHPTLGIGFNAWGFVQERYGYERRFAFSYSLDGGLIFIALMTGFVGLFLYLWMLRSVLSRARAVWKNRDAEPKHRGYAMAVAAITVSLLFHSLFGNSLLLPFLMETMWLLWAMLFVIARAQTSGDRHVLHSDGSLIHRVGVSVLKEVVEAPGDRQFQSHIR